jgi:hypothetical protein
VYGFSKRFPKSSSSPLDGDEQVQIQGDPSSNKISTWDEAINIPHPYNSAVSPVSWISSLEDAINMTPPNSANSQGGAVSPVSWISSWEEATNLTPPDSADSQGGAVSPVPVPLSKSVSHRNAPPRAGAIAPVPWSKNNLTLAETIGTAPLDESVTLRLSNDDDSDSSSLSIPDESVDFDLVYALHGFAATVEGQAKIVKGDSLFLMDDSDRYWWLVRVLKTQEVGYVPAENVEGPFERLARLNKHRNVDLSSATQAELEEHYNIPQVYGKNSRADLNKMPPLIPRGKTLHIQPEVNKNVVSFERQLSVHSYPPAIWGEDEEDDPDEWDEEVQ